MPLAKSDEAIRTASRCWSSRSPSVGVAGIGPARPGSTTAALRPARVVVERNERPWPSSRESDWDCRRGKTAAAARAAALALVSLATQMAQCTVVGLHSLTDALLSSNGLQLGRGTAHAPFWKDSPTTPSAWVPARVMTFPSPTLDQRSPLVGVAVDLGRVLARLAYQTVELLVRLLVRLVRHFERQRDRVLFLEERFAKDEICSRSSGLACDQGGSEEREHAPISSSDLPLVSGKYLWIGNIMMRLMAPKIKYVYLHRVESVRRHHSDPAMGAPSDAVYQRISDQYDDGVDQPVARPGEGRDRRSGLGVGHFGRVQPRQRLPPDRERCLRPRLSVRKTFRDCKWKR